MTETPDRTGQWYCGQAAEAKPAKPERSCETCRYKDTLGNRLPCSACLRAYSDQWEPKPTREERLLGLLVRVQDLLTRSSFPTQARLDLVAAIEKEIRR